MSVYALKPLAQSFAAACAVFAYGWSVQPESAPKKFQDRLGLYQLVQADNSSFEFYRFHGLYGKCLMIPSNERSFLTQERVPDCTRGFSASGQYLVDYISRIEGEKHFGIRHNVPGEIDTSIFAFTG